MAVTFESSGNGGGFPGNPITFVQGISAGVNRTALLAVLTVGNGGVPVVTASYNAVPMIQIGQTSSPIFGRTICTTLFQLLDASLPVLTGGYVMSYQSSGPYVAQAASVVYNGVQQTLAPVAANQGNQNPPLSGVQSVSIAGVSPAGLIVDAFGAETNSPGDSTPGAGQTERVDVSPTGSMIAVSDKPYSGSALQSMEQAPSSTYYAFAYLAAALREFSSGPSSEASSAFLLGTQG